MRKDDGLTPVAATQAARAPRSLADTQKLLGEIFASVLSVPDVSLEDNFFDLGATSLLMVRARNEIKTQFGRELAMNDLFEHTSIADLARFMVGNEVETKVVAAQARGARQNDLFQKLRKFAGKAPQ
jgi:acyl carrier protein